VLGLDEQSKGDLAAINRAFRKQSLSLHPDKAPGKEEEFKLANAAAEFLRAEISKTPAAQAA
jgi:curved DNA-binding protein CbpA